MTDTPPINHRLLIAEIEDCVSEFNRLVALAMTQRLQVEAIVFEQENPATPPLPILDVQVAPF